MHCIKLVELAGTNADRTVRLDGLRIAKIPRVRFRVMFRVFCFILQHSYLTNLETFFSVSCIARARGLPSSVPLTSLSRSLSRSLSLSLSRFGTSLPLNLNLRPLSNSSSLFSSLLLSTSPFFLHFCLLLPLLPYIPFYSHRASAAV